MTTRLSRWGNSNLLVMGLIGLHLGLFALGISTRPEGWGADAARFDEIATSHATPYREQPIEYVPLELGFVELAARDGIATTERRLAMLSLVSDLAIAAAIAYGWGRRACIWYLILCLALLPFLFLRFDLASVAVATWAIALIVRNHERGGGLLLAIGLLVKAWPIVLVTVIWDRPRALWSWAAWICLGLVAWIALAGWSAPYQVATFRSATGWEAGSVIGIVVLVATGTDLRDESGAARVGVSTRWEEAALAVGLVVILTLIARRYHREGAHRLGGAALSSVAALLVFAPVFSPQYVAWLLPWTAIGLTSKEQTDRKVAWISAAVIALTGVHAWSMAITTVGRFLFLTLIPIRNFLCVAILILWLTERVGTSSNPVASTVTRP